MEVSIEIKIGEAGDSRYNGDTVAQATLRLEELAQDPPRTRAVIAALADTAVASFAKGVTAAQADTLGLKPPTQRVVALEGDEAAAFLRRAGFGSLVDAKSDEDPTDATVAPDLAEDKAPWEPVAGEAGPG